MKITIEYKAVHVVDDDYFLERDPQRLAHQIRQVLKQRLVVMMPNPSEVDATVVVTPAIPTKEVTP